MQHLYDEAGRAYLDVYNNVPLVGHSHPRVVRAIQDQVAVRVLEHDPKRVRDLLARLYVQTHRIKTRPDQRAR